ncbi:DNA starvation/stationary phase protection protein [Palleronia sediminis]|uniref:DNA starvation/stationary phase protection protein n=1 Tax=Palleronia sediminis TaxID=2547833 RepID=A0A4V3B9J3_9RHOB|nr:DNA starvation/stationary phase protection protein [Palleronia sediminis]TDL79479.1 DNA starvation/stationary phase protection protein [Palleronia sediminis]
MAETASDLSPDASAEIARALNQALAETVVTTMLAQNFHWNVTGMSFGPLHDLFQQIYEDHFTGQDDLAERVRAIGETAEGKLAVHLERSKVTEGDESAEDREMIRHLLEAEETIGATLAGLSETAAAHGDVRTEDLAIERGRIHDKFAWMLRAHLR